MYQIKNTEIQVDSDNPFANCKLERLKYGLALEKLIARNHHGGVISLNGKWGTGKTTFVRMFAQMMENEGYSTVFFNAWETDFISDPLIALIGELEAINKQTTCTFEKVKNSAARIGNDILPALVKDAIKKYVGEETSELLADTIENKLTFFKAELERYNEEKRAITEFRSRLTMYVDEITKEKPLIFIIDELDRCNPHFAVKVLERVKHLFSIPKVIFILSIDKEQLYNSIKGYYGSEYIDSSEYLRRFIDVEYNLPSPNYKNYIDFELNRLDFASFFKRTPRLSGFKDSFERLVIGLSEHSKMTLRQIQKILVQLRLTYSTLSDDYEKSSDLLTPLFLLLYFRTFSPSLYDSMKTKALTLEELVVQIEGSLPTTFFSNTIENKYRIHTLTHAFVVLLILYTNNGYLRELYPLLKKKDSTQSPDELSFTVDKFNEESVLNDIKHYQEKIFLDDLLYNDLNNLIKHIELYKELQED